MHTNKFAIFFRRAKACRAGIMRRRRQPSPPRGRLLLLSVRTELAEVSPEVIALLLALDAGEDHLGARNLRARIGDVGLKRLLVPGEARILVRIGVAVVGCGARLAAVET